MQNVNNLQNYDRMKYPYRDSFCDTLKGILILLVILGHVLEIGNDIVSNSVYHFIYLFHMPLFVFISGFFTKEYISIKDFLQKNLQLIETFVIFHVFFTTIKILNGAEITISMLAIPYWIFPATTS